MKKLVLILMLAVMLVMGTSLVAFAAGVVNPNDPLNNLSGSNISAMNGPANVVIGALQAIATVVAICVLLYVGIKFMLASPGEKANLKGVLIPYIIGAVIIFATIPLLRVVQSIAKNIQ